MIRDERLLDPCPVSQTRGVGARVEVDSPTLPGAPMSDETENPEAPAEGTAPARMPVRTRPGVLTLESDVTLRPGFRNPPTPKSLARKQAKKGKK